MKISTYFLVIEKKEGNVTIIEGRISKSGREPHLVKTEHDAYACPVCRLNMDIKHTVSAIETFQNLK